MNKLAYGLALWKSMFRSLPHPLLNTASALYLQGMRARQPFDGWRRKALCYGQLRPRRARAVRCSAARALAGLPMWVAAAAHHETDTSW